jgi:hypothetical protein
MKTKGLSLGEAHASNRNYRRAYEYSYYRLSTTDGHVLKQSALAMDYELEPETVCVTREDLVRLLSEYQFSVSPPLVMVNSFFNNMQCALANKPTQEPKGDV